MDNNQNQQPNGYGMPQPNMQAGMPGQTPQPGYGTPGQTRSISKKTWCRCNKSKKNASK